MSYATWLTRLNADYDALGDLPLLAADLEAAMTEVVQSVEDSATAAIA